MDTPQEGQTQIPTPSAPPQILEQRHVTEVYDLIAAHFSSTRYKAWPRVENFLNALEKGAIVADVGCGNGKYLGVNPNVFAIGSDRTGKFAEICAEKGFESMICDNLYLPYRDGCFDSVISIAVVHHFASPDRRLQAIKELIRILRKGGRLLFTVWAIHQDWKNKQYGEQDVMIPWHYRDDFKKKTEKKVRPGRLKKKEERREKFQQKSAADNDNAQAKRESRRKKVEEEKDGGPDAIVDVLDSTLNIESHNEENKTTNKEDNTKQDKLEATNKEEPKNETNNDNKSLPNEGTTNEKKAIEQKHYDVYHRYYHLFKEGEIEDLFTHIPNVNLIEVVLDHDNWYVIVEKS